MTVVVETTPTTQSGTIAFDCGGGVPNLEPNNPAFAVVNGPVTATPAFTLPTGYTSLSITPQSGNMIDCSSMATMPLTSGAQISITTGAWAYCASFSLPSGGTLGTFDVTWTPV